MEQLLHYVWLHKIFPLKGLTTTDGQSVEVIDAGLHNTDAGPDFFNAKLKIDGTLWIGNVEIHQNASDWLRHGHDTDSAYDNVILHVVGVSDIQITRANGELIPQMVLPCPDYVKENYHTLAKAEVSPACFSVISRLQKITVSSWLSALQIERLEHKTDAVRQILERNNHDWEAALFTLTARYLGVGLNGDVFQAWAERLSLRAAQKIRDDVVRLEALFFGTAGLLSDPVNDPYMMELVREYSYQTKLYSLKEPMEKSRWRLFRLRPDSFPYIRMAQMAWLYHNCEGLFSKVVEADSIKDLLKLFECSASGYWDTHYRFGHESPERTKSLGKGVRNLLVINAAIPIIYAYGSYRGSETLCDKAIRLLEEMKAESNYITRQWDAAGIGAETAADSQALIELHNEYCNRRKCLFCRFGYEYMRSKNPSPTF
jgi:hypothetical protein